MPSFKNSPTFENKFIEVVELLLQQQTAAEARREAAHQEQITELAKLQSQLQTLAEQVETLAAPRAAPASPSNAPNGATRTIATPQPTDGLSEWERQKLLLLQGLDNPAETAGEQPSPTAPREPAGSSPSAPNHVDNSVMDPSSHDWIEHLDPNDVALSDEEERRSLVAKLRKLEVELSLERATLARDRSELDAQLSEIKRVERQQSKDRAGDSNNKNKEPGKKDRMLRFLGRRSP